MRSAPCGRCSDPFAANPTAPGPPPDATLSLCRDRVTASVGGVGGVRARGAPPPSRGRSRPPRGGRRAGHNAAAIATAARGGRGGATRVALRGRCAARSVVPSEHLTPIRPQAKPRDPANLPLPHPPLLNCNQIALPPQPGGWTAMPQQVARTQVVKKPSAVPQTGGRRSRCEAGRSSGRPGGRMGAGRPSSKGEGGAAGGHAVHGRSGALTREFAAERAPPRCASGPMPSCERRSFNGS